MILDLFKLSYPANYMSKYCIKFWFLYTLDEYFSLRPQIIYYHDKSNFIFNKHGYVDIMI